ncbi:MAG: DNA-directed RNA polymerase subunit omega [Helicobacteraceae bacterium]|nr:DNA-directed RNA polymerase subunit omega [Helicobacteraceae bacterium]
MRPEQLNAKALEATGVDRYRLAIAVSSRANELQNGAPTKLNIDLKEYKFADVALMELAEGFVTIKGFEDIE